MENIISQLPFFDYLGLGFTKNKINIIDMYSFDLNLKKKIVGTDLTYL